MASSIKSSGFVQFLKEKQAHIYPFFDILLNFFNYGFHIILSWFLLPEDYGVLNAVLSVSIVMMVMGISVQTYTARISAQSRNDLGMQASLRKALWLWTAAPLMVIVPAAPLFLRFTRANISSFILLVLLFLIHSMLSVLRGRMQGRERFLALNISFYIEVIVKITALLILLPAFPRVETALLSIVLGLSASLLYSAFFGRLSQQSSETHIGFSEVLKSLFPIFWANLMLYIFTSVDMLVVNFRFPDKSGYFAVTQKYGQLLFFAASSIMTVMFPLLSKYTLPRYAKEFRKTFLLYGGIFLSGLALALPVYRFVLPLSVEIVFSAAYKQAAEYIFLAGLCYTLLVIVLFLATVLMAMKCNSYVAVLGFGAAAITIGLLLIQGSFVHVYLLEIVIYGILALLMSMLTWKETGAMKAHRIDADPRTTVLFLSWRDIRSPKMGGAELYTHEMMMRSDHTQWRLVHFAPEIGNLERDEMIDGIRYLRRGGILSVIFHAWRFYRKNRKHIDFVVDQCNTHRFFTKFWVPAKKRVFFIHQLTREIWNIHCSFPVSFLGRISETALLRLSRKDPTMVVSNSTRDGLLDVGFDPEKTVVIPEGLNFTPWEQKDWQAKASPPVFLYAGRYARYKGIDTALKAFLLLKKDYPEIRFWIIGKRNEDYMLTKLAPLCRSLSQHAPGWDDFPYQSNDPESDIVYWGFVSEEEKLRMMSVAHLLVFPSIREGWGLIISEAAAVGTPSLVLDAPGTRDAVNGGETGYIGKDNSPESFAQIMKASLEDKDQYRHYQHKGHEFAQTLHWDRTGEAMNAFFSSLKDKR